MDFIGEAFDALDVVFDGATEWVICLTCIIVLTVSSPLWGPVYIWHKIKGVK